MNSRGVLERGPAELAGRSGRDASAPAPPTFAGLAEAVTYRWTAERDTWLAPSELEAVRSFLAAAGVATRELPDGSFMVENGKAPAVSGPRLFLLALRRLRQGAEGDAGRDP